LYKSVVKKLSTNGLLVKSLNHTSWNTNKKSKDLTPEHLIKNSLEVYDNKFNKRITNPLHRIEILTEILSKTKLFHPKPATLKNVEPFEKNSRALFIAQCPYKFSSFSILEMVLAGSDCLHVISNCFEYFPQDLHAFRK